MASSKIPNGQPPSSPDELDTGFGTDEWVRQADERTLGRSGVLGAIANRWDAIPQLVRMGLFVVLVLLVPPITNSALVLNSLGITSNDFILRVGTTFLSFSILAIGLNVVVGYAGLLDLGYTAFFGLAGYMYAYLSSDFVQFIVGGVHLPSIVSVPIIIAVTTGVGYIIGSTSIRLQGDYLAIVTLGFGQLFVQLVTTLTRVKLFWLEDTVDLTRGPNGINRLDEISVFGYTFESTVQYYYLMFALLVLAFIVVDRIDKSRVGRAWRAMHEDELATEVMGMPTRRLKLMAFAIGAALAALVGAVFAGWQGNVVPRRYDVLQLINLYAMVVMGGLGSLPGMVLGALVFTTLPEILRNVVLAGYIFYIGGLIGLFAWLKPRRTAIIVGGVVAAGFVINILANAAFPALDAGVAPEPGSALNQLVQTWLVIPENFKLIGNVAIGAALLLLLLTVLIKSNWRWVALAVSLYLLVFSWETRLAAEAAVTRILILGTTLVMLMITRPEGLLGKLRIEIV